MRLSAGPLGDELMVDTERHQIIYQAIADALFASVSAPPPRIVLTLARASPEQGAFVHGITSPDDRTPIVPDDSLYEATFELDGLLRDEGGIVQTAKFALTWSDESEEWIFESEYSYEPSPNSTLQPTPTRAV